MGKTSNEVMWKNEQNAQECPVGPPYLHSHQCRSALKGSRVYLWKSMGIVGIKAKHLGISTTKAFPYPDFVWDSWRLKHKIGIILQKEAVRVTSNLNIDLVKFQSLLLWETV